MHLLEDTPVPASLQPYLCQATSSTHPPMSGWYLHYTTDGLYACYDDSRTQVDFTGPQFQHRVRTSRRDDPLRRALGRCHNRHILDCCGGFGYDAMLMVTWGAQVTVLEQSPWVCALLQDGLRRAQAWIKQQPGSLTLIHDRAEHYLSHTHEPAMDTLYLDPMFADSKKSKSKLPLQCLQAISAAPSAEPLVASALATNTQRIVIKQAKHAPPMPSNLVIHGKSHRFDVFLST